MHVYQYFDWSSSKNKNKTHIRPWKIGTLTSPSLRSALFLRRGIAFGLFGNWCHRSLLRTVPLGESDTDITHMDTARLMSARPQSVQVRWEEYNNLAKTKSLDHVEREQVRKVPTPAKYLLLHLCLTEGVFPVEAEPRTVKKFCVNNTWLLQAKSYKIKP